MSRIKVTRHNGEVITVEGLPNGSLMESLREAGCDEMLALCGGCCSCATCHVYVDEENFASLPEMSEDENDLLESSSHRKATSRLSCQIFVAGLTGDLSCTIAPED